MKYSIIVSVFDRPDEADELLESLNRQTCRDFEVVVVEDGSEVRCEEVVRRYADKLAVRYFAKASSSPSLMTPLPLTSSRAMPMMLFASFL